MSADKVSSIFRSDRILCDYTESYYMPRVDDEFKFTSLATTQHLKPKMVKAPVNLDYTAFLKTLNPVADLAGLRKKWVKDLITEPNRSFIQRAPPAASQANTPAKQSTKSTKQSTTKSTNQPTNQPTTFIPVNLGAGEISTAPTYITRTTATVRAAARTGADPTIRDVPTTRTTTQSATQSMTQPITLTAQTVNRLSQFNETKEFDADDDEELIDELADNLVHAELASDVDDDLEVGKHMSSREIAEMKAAEHDKKVNDTFELLKKLQWHDRDEFLMTPVVLNKFSDIELRLMFETMKILADELMPAIESKTGALAGMSTSDKYDFLFHIIAKGRDLYFQTSVDPDFCLYLLDNYQPLYSFMKKKLRV